MRIFKLSLFLLSALFIFSSCEKDNFDLLEETEDPTEPVIIEEESETSFMKYLLPNGELVTTPGRAMINPNGDIGLSTAEEGLMVCEDGIIGIGNETPGMVLVFSTQLEENVLYFAVGNQVEGIEESWVVTNPFCEATASTLEITSLTDDMVAGTATMELFNGDPNFPGIPTECEGLISQGVFEVSFNLPLTLCE